MPLNDVLSVHNCFLMRVFGLHSVLSQALACSALRLLEIPLLRLKLLPMTGICHSDNVMRPQSQQTRHFSGAPVLWKDLAQGDWLMLQ